MSTLSSANVTDVNLALKERAHKIKMKYSMHQYSNSYAYFRQLAHCSIAELAPFLDQDEDGQRSKFRTKRKLSSMQNDATSNIRYLSVPANVLYLYRYPLFTKIAVCLLFNFSYPVFPNIEYVC